jgi:hypothetical protein
MTWRKVSLATIYPTCNIPDANRRGSIWHLAFGIWHFVIGYGFAHLLPKTVLKMCSQSNRFAARASLPFFVPPWSLPTQQAPSKMCKPSKKCAGGNKCAKPSAMPLWQSGQLPAPARIGGLPHII